MNMSELLNMYCKETGKPVAVGEIVAMFDHGDNAKEVVAYGHYKWDADNRCFEFVLNEKLDKLLPEEVQGLPLDFTYDIFADGVRKLTSPEMAVLTANELA